MFGGFYSVWKYEKKYMEYFASLNIKWQNFCKHVSTTDHKETSVIFFMKSVISTLEISVKNHSQSPHRPHVKRGGGCVESVYMRTREGLDTTV